MKVQTPRFVFAIVLLMVVQAPLATECGPFVIVPPETTYAEPGHHPMGVPIPDDPTYVQPTTCGDGVWFYDDNHNDIADPEELRLYGSDKIIACNSCHDDTFTVTTDTTTNVYLRQETGRLCLICHIQ